MVAIAILDEISKGRILAKVSAIVNMWELVEIQSFNLTGTSH
jgi:hypothetical protein